MKIYAHRGYSGKYSENTMPAFIKAAECGADGIELDVQLTKDGEVVIIHDESIERTTDGHGFVRDFTLKELRKFNAGKLHPDKTDFAAIPTFEEYCEWVSELSIITNAELKTGVFCYKGIEEKVLEKVRKYGLEDRMIFSSFNHLSMVRLKYLSPESRIAALNFQELGNAGYCLKLHGFKYYHPDFKILNEETVSECIENGIRINAWTANDEEAWERLYALGIEGIITNFPAEAAEWLRKKNR